MLFTGLSELSPGMLVLLIVLLIWELVWKLTAMWKAVKKDSVPWFIVIAVFNTLGILPILYIYVFSEMKVKKKRK